MKVHIKYFASIREAAGVPGETLDVNVQTLAQLRDLLITRGTALSTALTRGRALRMALNQVMADESLPLEDGCEVAFFPPVTGG